MARTRLQAKKIAREYAQSLVGELRVDRVALFGSHARGQAGGDSDLDLIVLSNDFRSMPLMKRLQLLNKMRKGTALTVSMDIMGLTPHEFSRFRTSESPNLRGIYHDARTVYP